MKGRKPRPTHLKIIEGEPNKTRINRDEPKPQPVKPTCPAFLSKPAKAEWRRISSELEKLGLLTRIDRAALAAYCQAYGRWVMAEKELINPSDLTMTTEKGYTTTSAWLVIANKSMAQMHKFLVEFGMTPSARSRITINVDDNDEAEDLLSCPTRQKKR